MLGDYNRFHLLGNRLAADAECVDIFVVMLHGFISKVIGYSL